MIHPLKRKQNTTIIYINQSLQTKQLNNHYKLSNEHTKLASQKGSIGIFLGIIGYQNLCVAGI